ncbi:seven-hairpin glycosidase [Massarina eburnea CBS 473.64]|uniref:alpha-1,2-Mannosidase n=1 Tax=Massarina eburnea CBS 473.64 TaxID=1395130 RepID=A0A6A6S456_9PLEO|nr:seven-hairpin glycosidase [Massarina eburnea CBS 473.64]
MVRIRRYGLYCIFAASLIWLFNSLSFSEAEPVRPDLKPHRQVPLMPGYDAFSMPILRKPKGKHQLVDWANLPLQYPVRHQASLPTNNPIMLPRIQHVFDTEDTTAKTIRQSRQADVKQQFVKCWENYRTKAWMHDELSPISGGHSDRFGGWAATLIDSLDTLWIMGLNDEFEEAVADVEKVDFGKFMTSTEWINVFETNIRHLGGLLSAYELSEDKRLLKKATEVGEMLYHAFDTPNHMPRTRWGMVEAVEGISQVADDGVLLAEMGTFTLEFSRLSQLTKDVKWWDMANRVTQLLAKQQMKTKVPGMWPIMVNLRDLDLTTDNSFALSSMADSAYEYLAKTYALLGGSENVYKDMYTRAMDAAVNHTLYRLMNPENVDMLGTGYVIAADDGTTSLRPELQHLSCYTGGMFALGGKLFQNPDHLSIGRKLTNTCVWAYKSSPAGIMPEVSHLYACPPSSPSPSPSEPTSCKWNATLWKEKVSSMAGTHVSPDPTRNIAHLRLPEGFTSIDDRRYILRPEAIESVFVMYRITGEQAWQAAAWDMWTAIQRATDTEYGNAALADVSTGNPPKEDSMESFWLSETLKYFYLVFSTPDTVSLDDWVFNTEAHPLRIMKPGMT